MEKGDRIYVEAFLFSGHATVTYIAPAKNREIFPIQIELDDPDENGHKVFRVNKDDIKEPKMTEQSIAKETLKRYIAVVNKKRMGFIFGERYIISEKNKRGYYHVYLANRPNDCPIGSYCSDFFKIISPYQEQKVIDVVRTSEHSEFKAIERKVINNTPKGNKGVKRKQKSGESEQLNMFDLLLEGIL